jgi:gliding motility-associated-like protein
MSAQDICEGSLGSNIFEGGEFGSGTDVILQVDPQIAPGYQYTLSPPPDDGFYTITNNTGAWSYLYPTWLSIQDNSADPNGYMMVVNASFDPGDFYEETITGLCENTFYEFSADIINLIIPGTADHIDPNVDFLLDGVVVYSTGTIPKTGSWTKYGFTFTTDGTQSEIRLTLRNNAPGGIGNDLALDNISFRPCGPESFIDINADETIFLCEEGDPLIITADIIGASGQEFSLFWEQSVDGNNWTPMNIMNVDNIEHDIFTPGSYYYRYISAANDVNLNNEKCRIISSELHLEVLPRIHFFRDTLCEGSTYFFNENELTTAGTYLDTLVSSFGCDSVITLDLIEVPDIPIDADVVLEDPLCYLSNDGFISIENITGGYGKYLISINDSLIINEWSGLGEGEYTVSIIDRYGCDLNRIYTLQDPELFQIGLREDVDLILGEELILSATSNYDIYTYSWSPSEYYNCDDCEEVIVTPLDDGYLKLTATNINGCIAVDSFLVRVSRESAIYFPNVFSPNEDGINDRFEVKSFGNSVRQITKMNIFDRWGNAVFSASNIDVRNLDDFWDGKIGGTYGAAGVYTYVLEVEFIDGLKETLSGNVTLIK